MNQPKQNPMFQHVSFLAPRKRRRGPGPNFWGQLGGAFIIATWALTLIVILGAVTR